jgi:ABC-type nitrate/sulfonate/bicarbonate transport system substrate-binding protein
MRGKKLGGARGSTQELLARTYLRTHGMDLDKDLQFVDLKANTDQLLALQRGDVDFIVAVVPSTTAARVKGYGAHVAFPYDAGEYTRLNTLLVVRGDLPKTAPELASKIVKAHVGAIDYTARTRRPGRPTRPR